MWRLDEITLGMRLIVDFDISATFEIFNLIDHQNPTMEAAKSLFSREFLPVFHLTRYSGRAAIFRNRKTPVGEPQIGKSKQRVFKVGKTPLHGHPVSCRLRAILAAAVSTGKPSTSNKSTFPLQFLHVMKFIMPKRIPVEYM